MPSQRSNGKWVARIQVDGVNRYAGTNHATKKAARQAEDRLRDMVAEEKQRQGNETIGELAARWVEDYPRPSNSTNNTNKYAARAVAQADFTDRHPDDLDRPTARRWAKSQPRVNARAARTMFSDWMNDGICKANPFANLRLEQSRGRKDLVVVTDQQLADLAVVAEREATAMFASYLLTAAYTCMRPGELNGLCWEDIDFQAEEIRVDKNIESPTGWVKWPKNGKPRRIVLPPPAREALRRVPRVLESVMIRDLRRPDDTKEHPFHLVFRGKDGGKLYGSKLTPYWTPTRAAFRVEHPESGLKDVYDLRHKGATMLLERGMSPADVAVQMGHTDGGALVMSTYGHPSEGAARERLRRAWREPVRLRPVDDEKEAAG